MACSSAIDLSRMPTSKLWIKGHFAAYLGDHFATTNGNPRSALELDAAAGNQSEQVRADLDPPSSAESSPRGAVFRPVGRSPIRSASVETLYSPPMNCCS